MVAHAQVVSLHIAALAAALMQTVAEVSAIAGCGIDGDRYCEGTGTYSTHPGSGREITLIETEALEALAREYAVDLPAELTRRNIVTRGVALNHLVGKTFSIGAVVLHGMRLCEPCVHLEKLTVRGAVRGLIHRGGLRADIVTGGVIRAGDLIAELADDPESKRDVPL